jgi:hypothetical protein
LIEFIKKKWLSRPYQVANKKICDGQECSQSAERLITIKQYEADAMKVEGSESCTGLQQKTSLGLFK